MARESGEISDQLSKELFSSIAAALSPDVSEGFVEYPGEEGEMYPEGSLSSSRAPVFQKERGGYEEIMGGNY